MGNLLIPPAFIATNVLFMCKILWKKKLVTNFEEKSEYATRREMIFESVDSAAYINCLITSNDKIPIMTILLFVLIF